MIKSILIMLALIFNMKTKNNSVLIIFIHCLPSRRPFIIPDREGRLIVNFGFGVNREL